MRDSSFLDQDKLNVVHKQRSNVFNWKGQFTPEFIEYLLDCYSDDTCVIADPFSGSGTVLIEAVRKGLSCVGFEVNPSAYFMSKFYEYAMLTGKERQELYNNLRDSIDLYLNELPANLMVYVDSMDYRESYANMLSFSKHIAQIVDSSLVPFMINVLFLCEKDKKLTLRESLNKNIIFIRDLFFSLPYSQNKVMVELEDARNFGHKYKNLVDLVITSPPYINVFNYHQNYRGIIECFGYDVLKVAASEIGSNRKHRSNRFKTVVQYSIDMGHVLLSISNAIKIGGRMIFVVGRESMVRKTPFYNSRIIEDIVGAIPSLCIESINERQFGNRYGEFIKEDIIAIKKKNDDSLKEIKVFEEIGMNHIKNALSYASSDLECDLLSILNKEDKVFESPIY